MLQYILVIIIVAAALYTAGVRIYRFFSGSRGSGCSPDTCATCPHAGRANNCHPLPEKIHFFKKNS
jgi:hypothetical protein